MNIIAKIQKDIYSCVTVDILTDEVILTNERLQHIKQRHPDDYDRYLEYIKATVEDPDYIIEANKPNSAVALKDITIDESIHLKAVVRLVTSTDCLDFKNSVITFQTIREKEWKRLLKNKPVLYKKNGT